MTDRTEEQRQVLEELAEVSRRREEYATAIWLLDQRQIKLRERLIAAGWKSPPAEVAQP